LVDKAREAAGAARKGDRSRALEKLEYLRAAAGKQASRADDLAATLRKMKESLERPASGPAKSGATPAAPIEPSKSASEAMRLLAKKMRENQPKNGSKSNEPAERMLERLERAGDEARRSAQEHGKDSESARAAKALSQAAEAMQRGDREAAAKKLEEAASRAEAMEMERAAMSAEADAIVDMLEKSGALEQAIQLAMLGREGSGEDDGDGAGRSKDGQGEGEPGAGKPGSGALRAAVMARLAALGVGRQESASGTEDGGHIADRKRAKRSELAVSGSMRAPSQVGEGERAVQAIRGLGRGSEPPDSYREVFPSYDAAAEEGLADERVPARRRAAVRRYFQAIRPDQPDPPESEKQP
jgi:anion-transporting  ArsA/GET3 family ATPase